MFSSFRVSQKTAKFFVTSRSSSIRTNVGNREMLSSLDNTSHLESAAYHSIHRERDISKQQKQQQHTSESSLLSLLYQSPHTQQVPAAVVAIISMASKASELHEATVINDGRLHDPQTVSHATFSRHDPAFEHTWLWEERPSQDNDVLTEAALQRIAAHAYVSGGYTWLDRFLNPWWVWITELLPRDMAPNLVTLWGALHCLLSYILTWYYAPAAVEAVPAWLLVLNGYCLAAAYTLDCMDGKQARRAKASSPLGQLLDHGLDSLCLLAHVSANQAWLRAGSSLQLQAVLQYSFFMAQWEEFYTRILPHATGPVGVTEVNYGMALISLLHGTLLRKQATAEMGLYDALVVDDVEWLLREGWLSRRLVNVLVGDSTTLHQLLQDWQRKDAVEAFWMACMVFLCALSVGRVLDHTRSSWKHTLSALSLLLSPLAVLIMASWPEFMDDDDWNNPATEQLIRLSIRWKSLALGLLYCHLTIKVIVYSMARQPVAVVQWDVLPLVVAVWWTVTDPRLLLPGHELVWQLLAAFWGYRLWSWNRAAIRQICNHLSLYLWSIEKRKKSE